MNNYGALLVGLGAALAHAGDGTALRSISKLDVPAARLPSRLFSDLHRRMKRTAETLANARESNRQAAADTLKLVLEECESLSLPVSAALLKRAVESPPDTASEYNQIIFSLMTELQTKLFVYVGHERTDLYENENILSPECAAKFPSCFRELKEAANCYVFGLSTACVFHAMRAAELATRALAEDLGVAFPFPLELAEMHSVLDQIESKILAKKKLAKSADKDAQLKFYSEAAAQFRYFKDAWRVRVAHARESFTDKQALSILEHVRDLLEVLSRNLTEPV